MNDDTFQKALLAELQKYFPDIPIETSIPGAPMNARNGYFNGIAKLIWKDIVALPDLSIDSMDDVLRDQVHLIIAQRVFDVVEHTIDSLWLYIDDTAADPSVTDIPDLMEWPERDS